MGERGWRRRAGLQRDMRKLFGVFIYLNCNDGFTDVYIYVCVKTRQLFILNICSILYASYRTTKLFLKKEVLYTTTKTEFGPMHLLEC